MLLLLPLAIFVWLVWLLIHYLNALVLRFLRLLGLMRRLPDDRAQGLFIGVMTTGFAFVLASAGSFYGLVGAVWLVVVSLNLIAAAILALTAPHAAAAE